MKILRLSFFNLKKNKHEAFAIIFLTMVTSLMFSIFAANYSKVDKVFDESFQATGSVHYLVAFEQERYRDEYRKILEEYEPTRLVECSYIWAVSTEVYDRVGEKIAYNLVFITEKNERKIEDFVKSSALSEADIALARHPIWLPVAFDIENRYELGDTFTVLKGGKEYPFTIVGFYETGLYANAGAGYKCIVSEDDYELFSMLFDSASAHTYKGFGFDVEGDFNNREYWKKCEEATSENITAIADYLWYQDEKANETQFLEILLFIIMPFSLVTMIASGFMVANKINNDIEEQMQQIGVLEALGYRSREISLSYLCEYVISGGSGSILGGLIAYLITPFMNDAMETMIGRNVHGNVEVGLILGISLLVLAVITGFALLKARTIKNYPPVVAFRKGIRSHHFGRNLLPLHKTRGDINVRLAMKSLFGELRSGIGVAICIVTAGMAVLISTMTFVFMAGDSKGLISIMGMDCDIEKIRVMSGVDPNKLCEELLELPEVRKAFVTYDPRYVAVKGSDDSGSCIVYKDFKDAEAFAPIEGRFPEHDNEVMIGIRRAQRENRKVGDSIVLVQDGIEKKYIVSGILSSLYNGGTVLYLNEDGYRRINTNVRPDLIQVYLEDGVDRDAFEAKVESIYGGSVQDKMGEIDSDGSLEEKIKAAAEEKIAVLLSQYGVTSVDYAIQIDDQLITGNSRSFIIKEITSFQGLIKTQLGPLTETTKILTLTGTLVITFVVGVILWIIATGSVNRQRHNLGIMKGLGYSSKDLRKQIALRNMPITIISMVIASVLAAWGNKMFWRVLFASAVETNVWVIVVMDIALILFSYFVTYIGASKIKKISVTELMTE